jgi:hypothetical protein
MSNSKEVVYVTKKTKRKIQILKAKGDFKTENDVISYLFDQLKNKSK